MYKSYNWSVILGTSVLLAACSSFFSSAQSPELKPTEVLIAETQENTRVSGGNSAGIGGDSIDRRYQTAWFYHSKPIITCYNYIPSFGIPRKEVEKTLKDSLQTWKNYLDQRKDSLAAYKPAINSNFSFKGTCTGEEDLRVYFGTGPIFGNLRDQNVAQTLGEPVAYVNKTHMATDRSWSRGYIRLVPQGYYEKNKKSFPDWTKEGSLKTMLLHEIGHLLGFEHIPGTIMEAGIADVMLTTDRPVQNGIDGSQELLPCPSCLKSYSLAVSDSDLKKMEELLKTSPEGLVLKVKGDQYSLTKKNWTLELPITGFSRELSSTQPLSNFVVESEQKLRVPKLVFTQFKSPTGTRQAAFLERVSGENAWILRTADQGEIKVLATFALESSGKGN